MKSIIHTPINTFLKYHKIEVQKNGKTIWNAYRIKVNKILHKVQFFPPIKKAQNFNVNAYHQKKVRSLINLKSFCLINKNWPSLILRWWLHLKALALKRIKRHIYNLYPRSWFSTNCILFKTKKTKFFLWNFTILFPKILLVDDYNNRENNYSKQKKSSLATFIIIMTIWNLCKKKFASI